jgi:hypothetical protein
MISHFPFAISPDTRLWLGLLIKGGNSSPAFLNAIHLVLELPLFLRKQGKI